MATTEKEIKETHDAELKNLASSLLCDAVVDHALDDFNYSIGEGADVNTYNVDSGKTPLILAIDNYNRPAIEKLLQLNADPNMLDKRGRSPLLHAVWSGDAYIISLIKQALLTKNGRSEIRDYDIENPLSLATRHLPSHALIEYGKWSDNEAQNAEIKKTLKSWFECEEGARPPTGSLCVKYSGPIGTSASKNIINLLLQGKVDINERDHCGVSPLMLAREPHTHVARFTSDASKVAGGLTYLGSQTDGSIRFKLTLWNRNGRQTIAGIEVHYDMSQILKRLEENQKHSSEDNVKASGEELRRIAREAELNLAKSSRQVLLMQRTAETVEQNSTETQQIAKQLAQSYKKLESSQQLTQVQLDKARADQQAQEAILKQQQQVLFEQARKQSMQETALKHISTSTAINTHNIAINAHNIQCVAVTLQSVAMDVKRLDQEINLIKQFMVDQFAKIHAEWRSATPDTEVQYGHPHARVFHSNIRRNLRSIVRACEALNSGLVPRLENSAADLAARACREVGNALPFGGLIGALIGTIISTIKDSRERDKFKRVVDSTPYDENNYTMIATLLTNKGYQSMTKLVLKDDVNQELCDLAVKLMIEELYAGKFLNSNVPFNQQMVNTVRGSKVFQERFTTKCFPSSFFSRPKVASFFEDADVDYRLPVPSATSTLMLSTPRGMAPPMSPGMGISVPAMSISAPTTMPMPSMAATEARLKYGPAAGAALVHQYAAMSAPAMYVPTPAPAASAPAASVEQTTPRATRMTFVPVSSAPATPAPAAVLTKAVPPPRPAKPAAAAALSGAGVLLKQAQPVQQIQQKLPERQSQPARR